MSEQELTGYEIVKTVARMGETRAYLKVALDAMHTAMAITPLGLGYVTVMGDLAKGIAAQLAEHNDEFEDLARRCKTAEKGAA